MFPTIKIYEDPTKQIQLHKQKYITYTINKILEAGHSSVIFRDSTLVITAQMILNSTVH